MKDLTIKNYIAINYAILEKYGFGSFCIETQESFNSRQRIETPDDLLNVLLKPNSYYIYIIYNGMSDCLKCRDLYSYYISNFNNNRSTFGYFIEYIEQIKNRINKIDQFLL